MYVNYLLTIGERNQVSKIRYSRVSSLRNSALTSTSVSAGNYSKQKPRRLPPIHSLNTSMPSIIEPFSARTDAFSSYSSDEDSFEESYSRLVPRFTN